MGDTKIEWVEKVWNPVTGCQKISPGCKNCYAAVYAHRFWNWKKFINDSYNGRKNQVNVRPFTEVQCHPDRLDHPAKWKRPRTIFVCSMGDLFHEDVPFHFIDDVFDVMAKNDQHIYLILTKRVDQLANYLSYDQKWNKELWPHVWFGASIENQHAWDDRALVLKNLPFLNRFVSIEPLIDPVDMAFGHDTDIGSWLHWVIAGGETGYGSRPMHPSWIKSLKTQCMDEVIPFFFKGWGNWIPDSGYEDKSGETRVVWNDQYPHVGGQLMVRVSKKKAGFLIDGKEWSQFPIARFKWAGFRHEYNLIGKHTNLETPDGVYVKKTPPVKIPILKCLDKNTKRRSA